MDDVTSVRVSSPPRRLDAYIDDEYRLRSHSDPSWIGPSVRPVVAEVTCVRSTEERLEAVRAEVARIRNWPAGGGPFSHDDLLNVLDSIDLASERVVRVEVPPADKRLRLPSGSIPGVLVLGRHVRVYNKHKGSGSSMPLSAVWIAHPSFSRRTPRPKYLRASVLFRGYRL